MSTQRLARSLLGVGVFLLLWPVQADATRFELLAQSGAQTMPDLQARLADPLQRPSLERRPRCGPPLLAPITYTGDGSLRRGCAGPNGRSMSLAVLPLLAAAGLAAAGRRADVPAQT
jgi:hypothetical protein